MRVPPPSDPLAAHEDAVAPREREAVPRDASLVAADDGGEATAAPAEAESL